jgi:hypothetical protein
MAWGPGAMRSWREAQEPHALSAGGRSFARHFILHRAVLPALRGVHLGVRALPNVGLGNRSLRSRSFPRGIDALHLDAATHRSSPLTCTACCSFCVLDVRKHLRVR